MRNHIFSLALGIGLLSPFASGQWVQQKSGTTRNLYGVSFTDANTGTVVGDSGTILRTTNGGATWNPQSSGTTLPLRGSCFTDAYHGTVIGDSGTILRTTDGGATWNRQSSGTTLPLRGSCFTDANNGTVVGGNLIWGDIHGIILHTTNAGVNWLKQLETDTASVNSVSFTDGNTETAVGGAVGDGSSQLILRTTDGGVKWTTQNSSNWHMLIGVWFTDVNTGTAVGGYYTLQTEMGRKAYALIIHTTDGGATWTTQASLQGEPFHGVFFPDANTGTAVAGIGIILHTTDGGVTWVPQSSGTTNILWGVYFTDANTGTMVGDSGTILHTTNGGVTSVDGEQTHKVPQQYLLSQNYPDPFNPSTTIRYGLPNRSHVTLSFFNIVGQQIAQLVNGDMEAGYHEVQFDGRGLSSGVYVYRFQAGDFTQSKRLLLLK
jgi:photosystem II stability/assembly factor-like uncharacterized protein